MNILFYENLLNPEKGGVQRVTYILAREFTQRCAFNCYVAHVENDDFRDESVFKRVCYCNESPKLLEEFIRKNKIDVVINQLARNYRDVELLSKICKKYNIKLISCLHISPNSSLDSCRYSNICFFNEWLRSKIKRLILSIIRVDIRELRYAYQKSDRLVVLSPLYIKQISELLKVNSKKIVSIYNPLSFENSNIDKKEKIVLVVSRMVENPKRISLVLKVWDSLQHQLSGWNLYIVGEGSHLPNYIKICLNKGLKNVHFVGRQDPRPYYEKATMFLMTSAFEGFGMTLIEAQQFGVIPIAFNTAPVFEDIINHGENGLLVPEGNIELYKKAIIEIANNIALRDKLAANAKISSFRFAPEVIANEWKKMLIPLVTK